MTKEFFGLSKTNYFRNHSEVPHWKKQKHWASKDKLKIFVAFSPYGLSKDECSFAVESFKDVTDFNEVKRILDVSFNRFRELLQRDNETLNDYVILLAPSTSDFMRFIVTEYLQHEFPNVKVYVDVIHKNTRSQIRVNKSILKRECEESRESIPVYFENWAKAQPDSIAKVSSMSASRRRYITNLVTVKMKRRVLRNKKVLVIDDTYGEGATFMNINDKLKEYKCEQIRYFAFVRDFLQVKRAA